MTVSEVHRRYLLLAYLMIMPAASAQQAPRIYAIQLESSRNPDLHEYEQLRDYGSLYTYREATGKRLIRVRLGYFPNRKQALQTLKKIRGMGFKQGYITRIRHHLKTGITIPQPPLATKSPAAAQVSDADSDIDLPTTKTTRNNGRYAIQLESSRHPQMADYKSLRQWGTLYIDPHQSNIGMQRVKLGDYDKLEDARWVLKKIQDSGFNEAYITQIHHVIHHSQPLPPAVKAAPSRVKPLPSLVKAPPPPVKAQAAVLPVRKSRQKIQASNQAHSDSGNIIGTLDYVVPDPFESGP